MALIKSAQAGRVVRDAIVLDLCDLQREGRRIIDEACRQAEAITAEAQAKARAMTGVADERGYKEGLQRGLDEGRELGRSQGRDQALAEAAAQIGQVLDTWAAALQQWEADRREMLVAAKEDVLAFAVAMGESVVHRMAQLDETIIGDQLTQALAMLCRPTAVVVTIHPLDQAVAQALVPKLLEQFANCTHIQLAVDDGVDRGGCRVATAGGRIDATIVTQLDRIVEALLPDARRRLDAHVSDDAASSQQASAGDGHAAGPPAEPGAGESPAADGESQTR